MSTKEKVLIKVKTDTKKQKNHEIVLFNDDHNTFDHVIETLIAACDHTAEQAEQCAVLVHYKGQCTVKTGTFPDLKPRCSKLLDAGLSAEILG
jgi:ATP-dependent Clp protease adaptor protein ClpS